MKYLKKIRLGFSLVELLLAFAVVMLITVSAFFIYKNVKGKSDVREIVSVIQDVSANIKTLYANGPVDTSGKILTMDQGELDFVFKQDFPNGLESSPLGGQVYRRKNFFIGPSQQVVKEYYTMVLFTLILPTSECPDVIGQLLHQGNYAISLTNGSNSAYAPAQSMAAGYLKYVGTKNISDFSPSIYHSICTATDISSVLNNYSVVAVQVVY